MRNCFDKISDDDDYLRLSNKIAKILEAIKGNVLVTADHFDYDEEIGKKIKNNDDSDFFHFTDIRAFCLASRFMYLKGDSSRKKSSKESIVFLKPYSFKKNKYIMVSATVDKKVCEYCFGKDNVIFTECKSARYLGTLNQYYDKSMSRTCIDNNPEILEKIEAMSGIPNMITFKKYNIEGYSMRVLGQE